jgi:hypothetical protein
LPDPLEEGNDLGGNTTVVSVIEGVVDAARSLVQVVFEGTWIAKPLRCAGYDLLELPGAASSWHLSWGRQTATRT